MADEYVKIGTTFRSSFDYPSPTTPGAWVTGLTQTDFTIHLLKDGTDGQSTTGITLTEDATTSGKYTVTVSGSTGFTAGAATWDLVIYRTSDTAQRWTMTIRVTSDGTGAGSWGQAVFTATASNGRAMASASPLSGATVRINDPNGVLWVQTTTDASGLWGPVYFPSSGTYTIYIAKAGYSLASAPIVVSGSSAVMATPADITLTQVSTATGLVASSLWAYAKRVLKDRSGAAGDLLAQQIVDDALTMISQEREWTWFHTYGTIDLQASYATGTVTMTNASATVTLVSGVFPSWAASGEIYLGGIWYRILSRDSDTQVTLVVAYNGATAAGNAYTLGQTSYTMPSDLQSLDEVLFDTCWPMPPQAVSMGTLMHMRSTSQYGQSRPSLWAIAKDQFVVWPMPSTAFRVNLLYYRRPALLSSSADNADWDPMHLALLRRAIEYQASLRGDSIFAGPEKPMAQYRDQLMKSEIMDKEASDRTLTPVSAWDYDLYNLRGTISR